MNFRDAIQRIQQQSSELCVRSGACSSCPYRRDVPAGIWHADEYEKLRAYDRDTSEQPMAPFLCHQQDGTLCAGWVAVHGMNLLGLRVGIASGKIRQPLVHTCGECQRQHRIKSGKAKTIRRRKKI